MREFVRHAAKTGFNAVSLDDVAHLASHEFYEPEVLEQITEYQAEFRKIFAIDDALIAQLVETAETCQVSIIDPGKPRNPKEPGVEDLLKRAAVFN